ncbi:hypothetical protein ACLMJK_008683 [Lecanora helva]
MRCVKANRVCGGYEQSVNQVFQRYGKVEQNVGSLESAGRKCSLPVQASSSDDRGELVDGQPEEVSDEKADDYAMRAFFFEFCITAPVTGIPRGYLSSLEPMLQGQGWQSNLAKACKIVGYASHSIKLRRPWLARKAELLYQDLLPHLARAIESPSSTNTFEALMIAMLLGLYEMMLANGYRIEQCSTHARGVAAILRMQNTPLNLLAGRSPLLLSIVAQAKSSCHSQSKLKMPVLPSQETKSFITPSGNERSPHLDDLLVKLEPIWISADAFLSNSETTSEECVQLRSRAVVLDQALALWQETQVKDFRPWIVGHISHSHAGSRVEVGHWPGGADTYFELYVAYMWNVSRAARVFLVDLVVKLCQIINDKYDVTREVSDARRLTEDIVSSIPFHLAEDLHGFLRNVKMGDQRASIEAGRMSGGLLLMYPVYIVSKLQIVPQPMREYLTDCLEWIATHMGIGQASLLAKVRTKYAAGFSFDPLSMVAFSG